MSHFLFTAATLRERSSRDSAEVQLRHGVWGCCTALIQQNLAKYLAPHSHGLVYVLKVGLCAEFRILSPVLSFRDLDDFVQEDLRTEARFGFVRVVPTRRWTVSPQASHALLQEVLQIPDQTELTRRLTLGMHRLEEQEYRTLIESLGPGTPITQQV